LDENIKSLIEKIERINLSFDRKETNFTTAQARFEEFHEKFTVLENRCITADEEKLALSQNLKNSSTQLESLVDQTQTHQTQLSQLQSKLHTKREEKLDLTDLIESQKQEITALTNQILSWNETNKNLPKIQTQLKTLNLQNSQLEAKNQESGHKIFNLQKTDQISAQNLKILTLRLSTCLKLLKNLKFTALPSLLGQINALKAENIKMVRCQKGYLKELETVSGWLKQLLGSLEEGRLLNSELEYRLRQSQSLFEQKEAEVEGLIDEKEE
jgi:chromosome segregation ATPase